jgi:2-aminoadipate transaminase
MSLERRRRLVALAEELAIPVFEDDPYSRVRYSGDDLPAISRLGGPSPMMIYASSFSKILAPGVRVAWTVASPALIRAMVLVRQGEDLCTSTVTQALVAEYCQRGYLGSHMQHIVDTYAGKCAAMQRSLEAHGLDRVASWNAPEGGFFYWLRLNDLDSDEAFRRAVAEKVAFVPGSAFYPGASEQVGEVATGEANARLCFTFADPDEIDEGCRRLAAALGV